MYLAYNLIDGTNTSVESPFKFTIFQKVVSSTITFNHKRQLEPYGGKLENIGVLC